jgi:hypothetical protein
MVRLQNENDPLADKSGYARALADASARMELGSTTEGKFFYLSGVVVLFCGVRRGIVLQVHVNRVCLVAWHAEYIAKSTAAVGDFLASALGFVHCRVRIDLRCPNSSNERTCCWESRAESFTCRVTLLRDIFVSTHMGHTYPRHQSIHRCVQPHHHRRSHTKQSCPSSRAFHTHSTDVWHTRVAH